MLRLLVCLAFAATPALAQSAVSAHVTLSADDQSRLGVGTAILEAREIAQTAPAIIRVLDPAPLLAIESERVAAEAALRASMAQAKRLASLANEDQSASLQSVEAARAQAAADQSRLDLLSGRLRFEWGARFADLAPAARASLLRDLTAGEAVLLRADAPQHAEGLDGVVRVTSAAGVAKTYSESLGLSGVVDPRMQTIGLFVVAREAGPAGLSPGRVLKGGIETSQKIAGVVIPREAVIRVDGAAWAYVQTGGSTFERREIADPEFVEEGWFVVNGITPGDQLVTAGAGLLLAVERADEAAETD